MRAETKAARFSVPLEGQVGYELRRASMAVLTALGQVLEPMDIRPGDASLLRLLEANPGCAQSDLCRAMRVKPANMVPMAVRLEKMGLIERRSGVGRALSLHLTDAGWVTLRQAKSAIAKVEDRIARSLPEDKREDLIAMLRLVCEDACTTD